MKWYDNDDDLERALFALPLEDPPADLRASILARTIYRAPLAVKPWELWLAGAMCAVLAWLLFVVLRGDAAPTVAGVFASIDTALSLFARPQTIFWIALGGGAALWISQLNLTVTPEALRATRR